jgi:hypothetical protein
MDDQRRSIYIPGATMVPQTESKVRALQSTPGGKKTKTTSKSEEVGQYRVKGAAGCPHSTDASTATTSAASCIHRNVLHSMLRHLSYKTKIRRQWVPHHCDPPHKATQCLFVSTQSTKNLRIF